MKTFMFTMSLLAASPVSADAPITTVILVRHAEKLADTMPEDVALSETGVARATELARVLRGTPIDAIYTTQWLRTRQTAAPVAKALGLQPRVVASGQTYAAELAKKIRAEHAGQTVLVVGHSNSTPNLLRELGIATPPSIPESQYDDLFICTLAAGSAKVVALRYGSVSVRNARVLALGDSYTIGESVAPAERWPNVLARELGIGEPQIIARTGWTTDELNAAIDGAKPHAPFDLVTLLIGVNNQYRGRDADQYRKEFAALLQRAIGFAGGDPRRVIVVSIPDWGVTPFAADRDRKKIAAEIDTFNRINREEANRLRARYVDVTGVSREAASNVSLTAPDRLHPSAEMYRRWVDLILPEAKAALGRIL